MYGAIINDMAIRHELPPPIVAAVILQESGGNTGAIRYEPVFFDMYVKDKRRSDLAGWVPDMNSTPSLWTEKIGRSHSWGLMQVMGDTARWCGRLVPRSQDPLDPARYFTALCMPEIGIDIGCRVLAFYLAKESTGDTDTRMRRALSRYNSGTPNSLRGLAYAAKVLAHVSSRRYLKMME